MSQVLRGPVVVFDCALGVEASTENNESGSSKVLCWKDARHQVSEDSAGEDCSTREVYWNLTSQLATAPFLVRKPGCRPHIQCKGNEWFVLENHQTEGFQLDYGPQGSTIAVVVKNDRMTGKFHEILGGAGNCPNAQVRFESPTELMVFPSHNFFRIQNSTDEFHSYVFRSANGILEVFQDGVKVPSKNNGDAVSTESKEKTRMASVGCWFSKHALQGRLAYLTYFDCALKNDETEFVDLLQILSDVRSQANEGWDFPAENEAQIALTPAPPQPLTSFHATFSFPSPMLPYYNIAEPPTLQPPQVSEGRLPAKRIRTPVDSNVWIVNNDQNRSIQVIAGGKDQLLEEDDGLHEIDACYRFQLVEPLNSIRLNHEGVNYVLDDPRIDLFEETFGDEFIIEALEDISRILTGFMHPAMSKKEIKQWQAMWLVTGQNEYAFSGLMGEQVLRAYSFRITSDAENSGLLLFPSSSEEIAELPNVEAATAENAAKKPSPLQPKELTLLHRDSSGECVCHGECALFVSATDACANILHDDSTVPVYLVPLVFGTYSSGTTIRWETSLNQDLATSLMRKIQQLLLTNNSDRILRRKVA